MSARHAGWNAVRAMSAPCESTRRRPAYARHEPTGTTLHRVVAAHLASFVRFAAERSGRALPRYVDDELRAYLRCGVLAHGFARVRGVGCGHDLVVAFSSSGAACAPRAAAVAGAPPRPTRSSGCCRVVPLRQWVLSVPFALRVRLAADPAMLNAVSRVLWEEMRRWYRGVSGVARGGDVRVEAAAITFVQRFGGALNLNVHFHVVTADGVWRCLPASVVIGAKDAAGRERLLRYVARPAVALDRVSELPDGRIAWRLKQPGGRGETHRIMEPMDFMARLVALIPPPRHPLVRYHGVFAPNSPWRPAVVPGPRPEELTRAATPRATTAPAADATQVTGRDGPASRGRRCFTACGGGTCSSARAATGG